jgi:hypothetical protein
MFLCEECTKKHRKQYPEDSQTILPISMGKCEKCENVAPCYDVNIHPEKYFISKAVKAI